MGSIDQHVFDIARARDHFPALKQDQIYFDNAGGSQVLGEVVDSIANYLTNNNVQMGATYNVGKKAQAAVEAGYKAAADYVNASFDEIVIGASTTQLLRNLSYSLNFLPGSEIIISIMDHESNISPWVALAARQQLVVKWWKPKDKKNPKLEVGDLDGLLSEKTKLVALTHCSNIIGSVHDVRGIGEKVHGNGSGAVVVVDGVAFAPHRRVDVKELGVDFYVFSWYKIYGPHIAMLYGRHSSQSIITPIAHYFNPTHSLRDKLDLASTQYECTQSLPSILSYFGGAASLTSTFAAIEQHEVDLQKPLLDYLASRDDVTIWGERSSDPKVRVATISFTVDQWGSRELVETIDRETRYGIRWGTFYSQRLVDEVLGLGREGVVRVSCSHYNTVEEMDGFIAKLDEILSRKK